MLGLWSPRGPHPKQGPPFHPVFLTTQCASATTPTTRHPVAQKMTAQACREVLVAEPKASLDVSRQHVMNSDSPAMGQAGGPASILTVHSDSKLTT